MKTAKNTTTHIGTVRNSWLRLTTGKWSFFNYVEQILPIIDHLFTLSWVINEWCHGNQSVVYRPELSCPHRWQKCKLWPKMTPSTQTNVNTAELYSLVYIREFLCSFKKVRLLFPVPVYHLPTSPYQRSLWRTVKWTKTWINSASCPPSKRPPLAQ